uniref:Uncharacterized protein n=1 Tax=Avena sativa TaxID=4498 RepID=A0ACD6AM54_AVESA
MDDVWNHEAWECVLKTPLVNASASGSRILVTTRDERVARGMKVVLPYHHIDKLKDEDAWSLLHKQVVSSEIDGQEIDMLKDIGLKIIAKCGGLPLAVKVMGGLLCQREKQRGDWQMVLNDSVWSTSGMPEELNYALYLSYEDLPPCVKQCFLYYSLLPKRTVFFEDDIIGMWISEGFIYGTSDDLEELGRKYHKELILRNLIDPDAGYVDQCVCNMHDVVRSFAQYVARDEALAAHSGETGIISKLSAKIFLRLSLEIKGSEANDLEWNALQTQKSLRTLISIGHTNMKLHPLVDFRCLRTLHIDSANVVALIGSLDQLKHLRYLSIQNSDISRLPDNIGNMKFLQYISLFACGSLVKLPDSIVKLGQLRFLRLTETTIEEGIPRGFCGLTSLRNLCGFPTHMGGDWCSLEELGSLSQLKILAIVGLENVSTTSFATKARLGEKKHLTTLNLRCTSRLGDDGLVKEEEGISEVEQRKIEEVFDELCPPSCLDNLEIEGYFGQRLPRWMLSSSAVHLKSLRIILMEDLACCTQLPNGLCQLSSLQLFQIRRAPSIKRIGPEFVQLHHQDRHHLSQVVGAAFPRLQKLHLLEMGEWKEWEWDERVQAMPVLEQLLLKNCKLSRVPPGLASHARALKTLSIQEVQYLNSLDNFVSLVVLEVGCNPDLESITNLPKLQKLHISMCPKLKVLESVPALQMLMIEDYGMKTLGEYMLDVNPRHLELECSLALLTSIANGLSGPEWDKFCHVEHVKAYAHDGDNRRKWYVLYTRNHFKLETNVSRSFIFSEVADLSSASLDNYGMKGFGHEV